MYLLSLWDTERVSQVTLELLLNLKLLDFLGWECVYNSFWALVMTAFSSSVCIQRHVKRLCAPTPQILALSLQVPVTPGNVYILPVPLCRMGMMIITSSQEVVCNVYNTLQDNICSRCKSTK